MHIPLSLVALVAAGFLTTVFYLVVREESRLKRERIPRGMTEAVWDGRERRQYPRWLFSCPLQYRIAATASLGAAMQAHVWDVSRGGIAIRLPERLPPGACIECEIMPAGGAPIHAQGEIRWMRELPRAHALKPREFLAGVQFKQIEPSELTRLLALSQEKEPSP